MFAVVYYLAFLFLYIISVPLLFFTLFRSKHKRSIPARFFLKNFSLHSCPHFWFHACSYGEIKSLEPIIKAIIKQAPQRPILLTLITQTGFELASKTYHDYPHIEIKFLPFEIFIPFWAKKLQSLQTLVVTEAELWFLLFKTAKNVGAKTLLINSRISSRSWGRYKKFAWFYKKIFGQIDEVLAQQNADEKRLQSLGAKNIEVFGNLKILCKPTKTTDYQKPQHTLILAASTHYGEEALILEAFLNLKKSLPDCALLIAPRHPERFNEVERIIKKMLPSPYTYEVFSQVGFSQNGDVLLVDTLGELNNLYAIADVVILGGSFAKVGGHNPLEPAFFGTKLITGPHIFNQNALFEAVEGYVMVDENTLKDTLLDFTSLPHALIKDQENKLSALIAKITEESNG
ncbi:lipid IV(A) 3-deoxy-D-manno-octulosonic acid transferase [Helicobacter sp. 11S02596-1]|uniref:lipid IV(A) 3-deoxy-D-manno-octulosonic acid transferase n=1 Tax=Helicobacter sp. 11S02596-1 TaxID=1476194 RepID=UPI000BA6ABF4|nr:lipid IV(A) 3-deoxy-D-manno-octulosonic acid transferase [Helicobacter sp. 11S02596-1]PAF45235.1 3-deoxy-D-manno-octulosonic acid transferase [Helicobacter sp. 11S02596-1]